MRRDPGLATHDKAGERIVEQLPVSAKQAREGRRHAVISGRNGRIITRATRPSGPIDPLADAYPPAATTEADHEVRRDARLGDKSAAAPPR